MKNIRFLTFVLTIGTLLLSACGAAATAATPAPIATSGSNKVDAMPVAFVGIVDSIAGDQWVISGTTVTVNASIVRNGPFGVGDRIKVEGFANPDGSFTVSRVEAPTPQEVATLPPVSVDNSNEAISNANTNDANINDDNSSGINSNDDNSNSANSNVNDDHGNDVNSNDANSNAANSNDANANINDDHGGNGNSNDDNSNTANSNDDKGGGSNSNDDNGGGGGNSNDDNGNGG
jgi:Domain of unknown function (DUF5666)